VDVATVAPVGSLRRFVLVGGPNTAVGFASFPVLFLTLGGRLGYLPILVACTVFNPCFSFLTHKFFTFAARGGAGVQAGRYGLFSVGTFFASWGFLALIDGWSRGRFVLAQIGFNVALTGVSFVVSRRFVFAGARASGRARARPTGSPG
jgi:putative flippase GtrA